MSLPAPGGRLLFANQLRGICVLCVMLIHYTTVVHLMRRDLAWVVAAPPLDGAVPAIAYWANARWFDLGKFGVGVFFLISGFVIPFSLRHKGAGRFLLARALRIYPTFWAALALEGTAIAASSAYWGIPAPYHLRDYVINGLLIETLVDLQTVDWVSWTLSVEVKFYVLAAVLRPALLASRVTPLLLVAGFGMALNAAQGAGWVHLPDQIVTETMFIGFILIGTAFHFHLRGAMGTARLAGCVAVLSAAFLFSYGAGPTSGGFWSPHTLSYGWAILAFTGGYALRGRAKPNAILDGLAAISYPLYLVHAGMGFTLISFLMMARGWPYGMAAGSAAAVSMVVAWALHMLVERPTIAAGRSAGHLGRQVSRGRPSSGGVRGKAPR